MAGVENRTGTGAELRDEEDGRVVSATGTDVSLLGLADQERLVMVLDSNVVVLWQTKHMRLDHNTMELVVAKD